MKTFHALLVFICAATTQGQEVKELSAELRPLIEKLKIKQDYTSFNDLLIKTHQLQQRTLEEKFAQCFALLRELDPLIDPGYDVENPPAIYVHVLPPQGYDSGISPDRVKDPKERADYAKRIEDNAKLAGKHAIQKGIRDRIGLLAFELAQLDQKTITDLKIEDTITNLPPNLKKLLQAACDQFNDKNKSSEKASDQKAVDHPK